MDLSNPEYKDEYALQLIRLKCEKSYLFFCCYMFWRITGQKFQVKFFHREICNKLEAVARGECKRLIINIPPRFGKTDLAVKYFVAWIIAINQSARFIHTSYSQSLALDNASYVKSIISHEAYQELWPVSYRDDAKAKEKWYTEANGGMYSAAHGGQITGFGAGDIQASPFCGALIIDDPLKADDAYSDVYRKRANVRFDETLINRLNNENVPVIVIMQRLHEEDLTGFLLENYGDEFDQIKIPALDGNEQSIWEERFSSDYFAKMKHSNPRSFAGQFMQEPAPMEGNIINTNWFNYFDSVPEGQIYQSWDTANKDGEENDYSACVTWCIKDGLFYVLEVWKDKLQFPDLVAAMQRQYKKWSPRQVLIEDKASGQQSLQVLRRSTNLPIAAYNPKQRSKAERMVDASIEVEAGRVYLNKKAHWLDEFLHEIKVFPNGKYKDTGDAFSMFINWYKGQKVNFMIRSLNV